MIICNDNDDDDDNNDNDEDNDSCYLIVWARKEAARCVAGVCPHNFLSALRVVFHCERKDCQLVVQSPTCYRGATGGVGTPHHPGGGQCQRVLLVSSESILVKQSIRWKMSKMMRANPPTQWACHPGSWTPGGACLSTSPGRAPWHCAPSSSSWSWCSAGLWRGCWWGLPPGGEFCPEIMVENRNNEQINKNIKTDPRFDFVISFYVFGLVCLVVDFLKGTLSPRENFWYGVGGPPLIPKTLMKISKKIFKPPKN